MKARDNKSNRDIVSTSNTGGKSRILGAYSFIRGDQVSFISINTRDNKTIVNNNYNEKENNEYNSHNINYNPPQEEIILNDHVQLSRSISIADPNDYGYYNLLRNNQNEENIKNQKIPNFQNFQNENKPSKRLNLLCKMNLFDYNEKSGIEEKLVKSNKELIYQYAREENDYKNLFIPSITELNSIHRTNTLHSKKSRKGLEDIDEYQQTCNSYIKRKQNYEISQGNRDHALQINFEYAKRKERFEIDLIIKLIKKYDTSSKPGSRIILKYPTPYIELKREASKLMDKYKKSLAQDKHFLNEIRSDAQSLLLNFIKRVEREVDDKPTNEIEVKQFKNYTIWKKKLSELVNIWELFQSNGIDMKFPIKYLVLKRFLSNRTTRRQNEAESIGTINIEENNFIKFLSKIFDGTGSKFVPRSILMPDEISMLVVELFTTCVVIYSLFSIPLMEFIGLDSTVLISFEKFVDVFFYIEMIINFRKAFKDKNNEFVYDLKSILLNYIGSYFIIDFFSTIPWYFFFIKNIEVFNQLKTIVMCVKVLRVVKLSEFATRLEQLKFAVYVRMLKLIFIFFFFAHWLGCILYYTIEESLRFDILIDTCYQNNLGKTKENITIICRYMYSIYNSAEIIPGKYTTTMTAITQFAPSSEYVVYIIEYMIAQILAAYIFGGMAGIIQSMNQGNNIFSDKVDMLNKHMMFYKVDSETMSDVKIYFDYLWQRHKDVIYGKHHFDLLSKSLREKFERLNLPGNEILLAKFYNLNPGNTKLIGTILINLSKTILFPFEILFDVGSVSKGVYILLNGDLTLSNDKFQNVANTEFIINYADVINTLNQKERMKEFIKPSHYDEKDSVVFPLVSAFIKTGRNWQRCHSNNFTDLLFLPTKAFDELIFNFPIEMHLLKHHLMEWVHIKKLFDASELFNLISNHSSRSVSKYFLKNFDKISIWIPIPIPISQRKISGNYIDSFIRKVRNQWREILLIGDLNMCLNSYSAVSLMKNQVKKEELVSGEVKKSKDPIDLIRNVLKDIDRRTMEILDNVERNKVDKDENEEDFDDDYGNEYNDKLY